MQSIRGNDQPRALAVVTDIAATWDDYGPRRLVGARAPGLILHVAGPTDDGVRTITVWSSADAWHRYRDRISRPFEGLVVAPVVRQLDVRHLVSPSSPPLSPPSHELRSSKP